MTTRKALMLIKDDLEMQAISCEMHHLRAHTENRIKHYRKVVAAYLEKQKARDEQLRAKLRDRLSELGISVIDTRKHSINVSVDDGVIWLESEEKDACDCPVCTLAASITDMLRSRT